jgi:exodeoxyribonuclease-1
MAFTFYWHDYETWGEVPSVDKPSQFAGVRTDEALNVIGKPLSIYCQPPNDYLPKPEACLVTGLTPQYALKHGLPENQFIARIHAELSQAGTCGVGYNSLRFDDEVTRYALYRNFYDPYEREWRNGNSRWDIIDMLRLCYALRPEEIEWPRNEDGSPSFRLELLTTANNLSHESAHDALSDVYATIALAKLIKAKKQNLYDYALRMRSKKAVAQLIDLNAYKPLLHVSSRYPASQGCAALVMPIAMHPVNSNGVIMYDLSASPDLLTDLSSEEIAQRVFTRREDLDEGQERVPLKVVHLNKCPMLATPKLVDDKVAQRLQLDKSLCDQHWRALQQLDIAGSIAKKVQTVFEQNPFAESSDPEQALYQGFLNDRDKTTLADVRAANEKTLASTTFSFYDKRLPELLFRYRARNFPKSLSKQEQAQWQEHRHTRLRGDSDERILNIDSFNQRIDALVQQYPSDKEKLQILKDLQEYGQQLAGK